MTVRKTRYAVHEFQPGSRGYEALVALDRIVSPGRRAGTVEEMQKEDANWPEEYLFKRFVVDAESGETVAVGICSEAYWLDQHGTVHLHFDIHPAHPQSQILPILYEAMRSFLVRKKSDLQSLASGAREDEIAKVRFLLDRGFRRVMRSPAAALRVAEFNPTPFAPYKERLAQGKIGIFTLAQLKELDPEWKRKLRDLRWAIVQDVPSPEPFTKPTLAQFDEMILQDPELDEEAFFVALAADGAYIGMSNLWRKEPNGKRFGAGLTGVVRMYRRRGIATALKVRTIQYAQSVGAETIVTSNEENNPMYALNLKLGFKPTPAWMSYHKTAVE
jgi:mycothiol synthase